MADSDLPLWLGECVWGVGQGEQSKGFALSRVTPIGGGGKQCKRSSVLRLELMHLCSQFHALTRPFPHTGAVFPEVSGVN